MLRNSTDRWASSLECLRQRLPLRLHHHGQVDAPNPRRRFGLGRTVCEPDGTERYIEVKITAFSESTPFYISANELRFARSQPARFKLCRVFDFRATPRLFELSGPVENHFFLDPTTYRASLQ
jgi:hypothetical protein